MFTKLNSYSRSEIKKFIIIYVKFETSVLTFGHNVLNNLVGIQLT